MHPSLSRHYLKVIDAFTTVCAHQPDHQCIFSTVVPEKLLVIETALSLNIPSIYKLFLCRDKLCIPNNWLLYGINDKEPGLLEINRESGNNEASQPKPFIFGKTGDEDFLAFSEISATPRNDAPVIWCSVEEIENLAHETDYAPSFEDFLLDLTESMAREKIDQFNRLLDIVNECRQLK